jgi:hypothetical protein
MNAWVKPSFSRIKAMAVYQRNCSLTSSVLKQLPDIQYRCHQQQAHQHTANNDERRMTCGRRSEIALAVQTCGG